MLAETTGELLTCTQHLVADGTPRMKHEAVGRNRPSKSRGREELMTHSATTIRLLKIPMLPLSPALLLDLSQRYLSFPLLSLSFLPRPLLLPHVPLIFHAALPFLPIYLLTLATDPPAFPGSPLVASKSQERSGLPTLLALPLALLRLRFADLSLLHFSPLPCPFFPTPFSTELRPPLETESSLAYLISSELCLYTSVFHLVYGTSGFSGSPSS